MKAILRKMGMDFKAGEKNGSDVLNYRVRIEFTDKNGIKVVVDFGGFERKEAYVKKSGKAAYKTVNKNALYIDGCYRDADGTGRDYVYLLHKNGFDFKKYDFTISGILQFLTDVTGQEFTEIEFIN